MQSLHLENMRYFIFFLSIDHLQNILDIPTLVFSMSVAEVATQHMVQNSSYIETIMETRRVR